MFGIIKIYTPIKVKWGIKMKSEFMTKKVFTAALVIIIALFCTTTVFAIDADGDGYDDETGEYIGEVTTAPINTEPVNTEPEYTDPVITTEPQTEPVIETTQPHTDEPQTEPNYEEPTENVTYAQSIEPDVQPTTEFFQPPTLAKTVSKKQYSTNYTAGIISWACVAVGVLVIFVVLVSNKLSGKRNSGYR